MNLQWIQSWRDDNHINIDQEDTEKNLLLPAFYPKINEKRLEFLNIKANHCWQKKVIK